ncbi:MULTISPECIES: forespore capture DNA-binding protein RefZ [Heyndrickxia]|jgi:AcrR family transcriptional regulator|uniref:TetR family transcriptional regulator n=1 Tax=Heyndrickxia oleronia TaxID=38875 RepID=A0A8E2LDB0_9BACI|nr:forespore capture DNA-binding protein RefZ [Heyndrickxia oleronia]NYV64320.1 forespore capture DNA-binding protein RefZ [Bacillus sp. Gen3]OJH17399.1 TetR family transcriptional regulator [Bacillus obstructivus]MCI1592569.1 forespore capture DNA-binding protein RefZ [Heyndrickxia oleronia]MCI1612795.1 forespore capture DNA-binding protein RefZ [Heyndrickxia oleronia]MCI1743947.1 forespore capture DNA-binding protein RefZ [Heyndrickxia oleronia]
MAKMSTKDSIIDAAISLFNIKGYSGTSVRDIAKKARVNPANISYYFDGKQGLLEKCFIHFFEAYLAFFEEEVQSLKFDRPENCLKRAIYKILYFQSTNHLLARFVWREVSIDSQIVREITSSYFMKERYLIKKLIEEINAGKVFSNSDIHFLIIQLRSLLTMPFLNGQYLREVWNVSPHERYFVEKYYQHLDRWIEESLVSRNSRLNIPV